MTEIFFRCKNCNSDIKVTGNKAGSAVECPQCKAQVLAPPPGIKPKMTIGGFKLIKCLGTGGMGEVWLANQDTMDREVALKILSPTLTDNDKFVSRFLQEVKISAKLHHPNIVTSFYAGVDRGIYYLAISYVDGKGLDDKIFDEEIVEEKDALQICLKVGEALKYAWNKFKIVHRDIKPGNIMISSEDKEVHLMDMGISKNLTEDSSLTMTGMIIGTPYYMSPEQARGDLDLDCRADIYALGSTLFHMVTGDVPYDSPNTMGILTKLISEPFPNPQERNPKLSNECTKLLEKMMAKRVEERFAKWEDVIGCIHEIINPSPPTRIIPAPKLPEPEKTPHPKTEIVPEPPKPFSGEKTEPKPTKSPDKKNTKATVSSCPSCGTKNKVDALFCVKCGKSLSQTCPECSEKISIFMNFCSKCGMDIRTISTLEDTLSQIKKGKENNEWTKIASICKELPDKKQLAGKKASKILTEIIKIKNVAEKKIHIEEAYDKADKQAKELTDKNQNIEAINALHSFLDKYPKTDYTPEIIHRINKLKKVSYQGPSLGEEWTLPEVNMEFIPIPAGEFLMGSPSGGFLRMGGEKGRRKNEGPQHKVTISEPFWIGKFPVTIAEFLFFMKCPENQGDLTWPADSCTKDQAASGAGTGCWGDLQNPMVEISWIDTANFCKWLTSRDIRYNRIPDGYIYRLPTEAEWEYCCRAGTTTSYNFGNSDSKLRDYAWYRKNSNKQTHPVGQKNPNAWGIYDMLGNTWEWCQDKYGDYPDGDVTDPFGSNSGVGFIRRGGSWINDSEHCRSAYRNFWEAKCAFNYLGFRLVLAPTRIRMRGTPI